jgi:hypothetical protein
MDSAGIGVKWKEVWKLSNEDARRGSDGKIVAEKKAYDESDFDDMVKRRG